ncbi:MAG TPA: ABC transporter permease [Acidimicrobiales bacterium]|jgi:ABC-2 type transport system permease protein|nr:ABC transporter permease [Acidimicrobiales bacterium]
MTALDIPTPIDLTAPEPGALAQAASRVRDIAVMTRRNLVHIAREPMQLSDVTVQPVLFTVLFVYVFGSGMSLPGGASYTDFVLAGLLTMNLVTSSMGTGVGLATDLATGMVERFRTLPMWRSSVLVGRTVSDLLSAALCSLIVALTGLAVGWRADNAMWSILAGFGVALFFSYALTWPTACLGLLAKEPESAMSIGFVVIFPLAFVSNALVPTLHMPSWLRVIADWNPVSSVTSAVRDLWGNPNPMPSNPSWPVEHPLAAALLWSVALIVVAAPIAAYLFRRRTTD